MNKHFLNEKGITLVELLAALVLFAIVSALVMTVLFNVFQNSENISDNAQLRQDANLLISTLRSNYNQGDFKVELNGSKSLLIEGQEVNSSMTSSIDELKLENGENSISAVNEIMDVTADGTPLSIDLKLKNEAGQTYSISTTIEKPAKLAIALLPVPPDIPDKPDDVETYTEGRDGEEWNCNPKNSDTKYTNEINNQIIPDACTGEIKIDGNVWIADLVPHHNVVEMKHNAAKINVKNNFFVDSKFNIDNHHSVEVKGHALFNRRLELKDNGKLLVYQNIHAANDPIDHNDMGVVVRDYTLLDARQSIVVDRRFHILGNGHAKIGENLFAVNVEADSWSIIDITGSASISNKLLAAGNSQLNIGESLIIDGDLEMSDYVKITVEGNARINGDLILGGNSYLNITGNLTIKGDVRQDDDGNNGTLHVGGETNFSKGKPEWLPESLNVED